MKELFTSATFLTVISGVIVYVISQLFLELCINPLKRYMQLKEKIAYTLALYSNLYNDPLDLLTETQNDKIKERYENASSEMRRLGAELAGYIGTIPQFKKNTIARLREALHGIIGISNCFYIINKKFDIYDAVEKYENTIKKNLNI